MMDGWMDIQMIRSIYPRTFKKGIIMITSAQVLKCNHILVKCLEVELSYAPAYQLFNHK